MYKRLRPTRIKGIRMDNITANLYKSERGVKVLVDANCNGFFDGKSVYFDNEIERRITLVEKLTGTPSSIIAVVKPDIFVEKDPPVDGMDVLSKDFNKVDVKLIDESGKEGASFTLYESNGDAFFLLKTSGGECTYSQYLFIDQLKSLKAKLNID